jgi:predicted nucleic acid-binding protein
MILVDTGPLVALSDPRDGRHRMAVAHVARFARVGLVVCEAVLTEACFHLSHVSQRQRLRAILDELQVTSLGTSDLEFRSNVFAWLLKYGEHTPDWADGCLAVLCGRDTRLRVWTYDREFRTTWRLPNGKAIPMAVKAS